MRFNFLKRKEKEVVNHAAAKAWQMTPETELYAAVVTASLSDNFYENAKERVDRIRGLITKTDTEFVARLAIYARKHMNMRSIPLVLAVELARKNSGNDAVRRTVRGVVNRADEISEMLAYYQAANQRKETKKLNRLSRQLQKGLADAFNQFDEYQFAKYNRAAEVKLRDALFLVHPKAKDEAQQELFNKIATDTLAVPYTWETELSALGQKHFATEAERADAVATCWEQLIDSNRLGYMATLRNLRNIVQAGVSYNHMRKVCNYLANQQAVANGKQLPFRYLAAFREMLAVKSDYSSMVLTALEQAIAASAANLKGFDEHVTVAVACDVSGSMQKPVSAKSSVLLYDVGLVLGMLLKNRCKKVITGMFGDRWLEINMPATNILTNVQTFYQREGEVGYSTNGHLVLRTLLKEQRRVDKVMMFTDCQMWNSTPIIGDSMQKAWADYRQAYPAAQLYLFDLAGYGNTPVQMKDNGVFLIAGWSDKVFDVLSAIEDGASAVEKIKEIVF